MENINRPLNIECAEVAEQAKVQSDGRRSPKSTSAFHGSLRQMAL